jgi:hypothetical protein
MYDPAFRMFELDSRQRVSFTWLKKDTNKFISIFVDAFTRGIAATTGESLRV